MSSPVNIPPVLIEPEPDSLPTNLTFREEIEPDIFFLDDDSKKKMHKHKLEIVNQINNKCKETTHEFDLFATERCKNASDCLGEAFMKKMEPKNIRDNIMMADAENRPYWIWMLECREVIIETEMFLQCPDAVVIAFMENPKTGGHVVVRIRKHSSTKDKFVVVSVNSEYCNTFFTKMARASKRYFKAPTYIKKYDKEEKCMYTEWTALRHVKGNIWEVRDKDGTVLPTTKKHMMAITEATAHDMQRAEIIRNEAKKTGTEMKFMNLSVGAFSLPPAVVDSALSYPRIAYRCIPGKNDCSVKAIASMLFFLGLHAVASSVFLKVESLKKTNKRSDMLELCFIALLDFGISNRGYKINKNDLKIKSNKHAILATLRGKHNGVKHAIAITRGLIFDSNQHRAMPFSRESLDIACGGSVFCAFKKTKRLLFSDSQLRQQQVHHDTTRINSK